MLVGLVTIRMNAYMLRGYTRPASGSNAATRHRAWGGPAPARASAVWPFDPALAGNGFAPPQRHAHAALGTQRDQWIELERVVVHEHRLPPLRQCRQQQAHDHPGELLAQAAARPTGE